ncbi:hypothetical protein LMHOCYYV_CDS0076 [Staphylococcus phage PG-2021_4]
MEIDIKVFKHEEKVEIGDLIEFSSGEHIGIVVEQRTGYNILVINNDLCDILFDCPVELEKIQEIHECIIRKKNEYNIKLEEN